MSSANAAIAQRLIDAYDTCALIDPIAVTDENRASVAATLASFELTLWRGGTVVARGNGDNVLGSRPSPSVSLPARWPASHSSRRPPPAR